MHYIEIFAVCLLFIGLISSVINLTFKEDTISHKIEDSFKELMKLKELQIKGLNEEKNDLELKYEDLERKYRWLERVANNEIL